MPDRATLSSSSLLGLDAASRVLSPTQETTMRGLRPSTGRQQAQQQRITELHPHQRRVGWLDSIAS